MPVYYFDSSAIAKRYITEVGSNWVANIADASSGNDILISMLARVEVAAAIFKRQREGSISAVDAASAVADFINDFESQYQPMDVPIHLVERAADLAQSHALRSYDAVQLATALESSDIRDFLSLPKLVFVSADKHLNMSAQSEGLTIDNPSHHP